MFLSHTQGTGQDQVEVLKYKLGSLVPSAEIFIDTDMGSSNTGLISTSDLQHVIENTSMMVYFVTIDFGQVFVDSCLRDPFLCH